MEEMRKLRLEWLAAGRLFAVCRLLPGALLELDSLRQHDGFVSVTRTDGELSAVLEERLAARLRPERIEPGFVALRVAGTLEFALVGILAKLTQALSEAAVPVFVISTFDTDILLVKASDAGRAVAALRHVAEVADLPA